VFVATLTLSGDAILTVTRGGVLYRDDQKRVCWLDLRPCRDAWLATRSTIKALDRRMVGCRNPDGTTPIFVRFYGPESITFTFTSTSRRHRGLIEPLSRVGWYTVIASESDLRPLATQVKL
jgi:hypothetical protein